MRTHQAERLGSWDNKVGIIVAFISVLINRQVFIAGWYYHISDKRTGPCTYVCIFCHRRCRSRENAIGFPLCYAHLQYDFFVILSLRCLQRHRPSTSLSHPFSLISSPLPWGSRLQQKPPLYFQTMWRTMLGSPDPTTYSEISSLDSLELWGGTSCFWSSCIPANATPTRGSENNAEKHGWNISYLHLNASYSCKRCLCHLLYGFTRPLEALVLNKIGLMNWHNDGKPISTFRIFCRHNSCIKEILFWWESLGVLLRIQ